MRKVFSKLHLWLSVPFGLIISVVCLSGAALVFEQDITQALHPEIYRVQAPAGNGTPLRPSEMALRIRAQVADSLRLSSLLVSGNPEEPCMAGFENTGRQTLSVNPYTGETNGWTQSYPFFQTMRKLHRWLMDAPAQRGEATVGKRVVGIATIVMVVILLTGLILWIPRTGKALRNRLTVSCTKGWRRFWFDSHVSLGFYVTLLLLIMALTGLTWSFGWYRTAVYGLFGGHEEQTARTASAPETAHHGQQGQGRQGQRQGKDRENTGRQGGRHNAEAAPFDYAVWDNALEETVRLYPTYKSIKLGTREIEVAPDPDANLRQTDKLQFDPHTGKIVNIVRYQDVQASQRLRGWFYALHTGSWGGMLTKVLYFLAAFIGGILPLSGYYLWYKRTRTARRNKRRP